MTELVPMTDIAKLFATPPEQLQRQDIQRIVAYYREKRLQFAAASLIPKEKKTSMKKSTATLALGNMDDIEI